MASAMRVLRWLVVLVGTLALIYFNSLLIKALMPSLIEFQSGTASVEFLDFILSISLFTLEIVFLALVLGGLSTFQSVRSEHEQVKTLREDTRKFLEESRNLVKTLQQEVEDQKSKNEQIAADLRKQSRYDQAIMRAMSTLLSAKLPEDVRDQIAELENLLLQVGPDRRVAILLGRLYADGLGDTHAARSALSRYILQVEGKPHVAKDLADVLYNHACYTARLWAQAGSEVEKDRLAKEIVNDLEKSFALRPGNREDAKKDPDFDSVREETWFKALVP